MQILRQSLLCCLLTGVCYLQVCSRSMKAQQQTTLEASRSLQQQGSALLHDRSFGRAMDCFEAILARSPNDREAQRGESRAATAWAAEEANSGQGDQGMSILERAMQHVADDPGLYRSFGLEAIVLGQLPIAEQALRAANRLRPDDPETTYALARLAIAQGKLTEAEQDLRTYLNTRPRDASAYYGLGQVYLTLQKVPEAKMAFARSVALQPAQTESYYELGEIALDAQQDAKAKALFGKVVARAPQHAGALTGLGQLAFREKDYLHAETLLAQAEAKDPNYAKPHYYRGLALARLGRTAEAEQEFARGDGRPHAPGLSVTPQQNPSETAPSSNESH